MTAEVGELSGFVVEIRDAGVTDVVLLGMGGSSLAPEVLMTIFGNAPGFPALRVLDSTYPDAISTLLLKGCQKKQEIIGNTLFMMFGLGS